MRIICIPLTVALLFAGCDRRPSSTPAQRVILYTSIDDVVARPIIENFQKKTGIEVTLVTDAEASKTVGLVQTLRAEKANPRADVFWNNEVFHTISLAQEGVLGRYESPASRDIPARFKDAGGRWAASGIRLRVIARGPGVEASKVEDLLDPKLRGKICMGKPALGTIAGQVASWFVKWGPAKAEKFLRDLKANDIKLVGGNSDVVRAIAAGGMLAGLTDNDDVDSMIREGAKMSQVPARLADDGTLAIPLTVAIVNNAKNLEPAEKLIDYLLSPEVEKGMMEVKYAARSVRDPLPAEVMKIDYAEAARMLPAAVDTARRVLEGRE